jgi:hypothetical protein
MARVQTLAELMAARGVILLDLAAASGVDSRIVEAIVQCRYTPSPEQRQRLAAALEVGVDEVAWGHSAQVTHVYGHGPQFGRSP